LLDIDGAVFVLSGPEKQVGRGSGGIGFCLSQSCAKAWERSGSVRILSKDGRSMAITAAVQDEKERDLVLFLVFFFDSNSDNDRTDGSDEEEQRARASAAKEQHTPRAKSARIAAMHPRAS